MKCVLRNEELAARFRLIAQSEGEAVWNRQIVIGDRRFSCPFMNTTWLARHLERGSLVVLDPDAWVVESTNDHDWRLYLRVGERYGEGWVHHFVPPVEVAVNSPREFIVISLLPSREWWQAEFVCPFCGKLCWEGESCSHLMINNMSLRELYRKPRLISLLNEMRDREFNCNMLNADIEGLRIKVPRNFVNAEWFRFAYWYIRTPELVDRVEQVLLEGRRGTFYDIQR
jgi:hypothetical protein